MAAISVEFILTEDKNVLWTVNRWLRWDLGLLILAILPEIDG